MNCGFAETSDHSNIADRSSLLVKAENFFIGFFGEPDKDLVGKHRCGKCNYAYEYPLSGDREVQKSMQQVKNPIPQNIVDLMRRWLNPAETMEACDRLGLDFPFTQAEKEAIDDRSIHLAKIAKTAA